MSFVGYLDKITLETAGGDRRKDIKPSRRRGIQRRSRSPAIIDSGSTPSSLIAHLAPDSAAMDTSEDDHSTNSTRQELDSNSIGYEDEDEQIADDDHDEVTTNPDNPFEFAPHETFDEERLMEQEHWSRGQLDLWHKIKGRGSYPLFPQNWMLDFSNLPDELFVDSDMAPIIGAVNRKMEVRAILAFDNLMNLGGRVRDKWESGLAVERWLGKELEKYVVWAMKDGDIPSTYTGVFAIAGSPVYEVCERRMSKRMAELSERHRTALETSRQFYASRRSSILPEYLTSTAVLSPSPLPPAGEPPAANLYGFAIVGCVVALVTLNTAKVEAPMRTLLVVDYNDPGMDVWNAVAVALMVTHARDEQMARVAWGRQIVAGIEDVGEEDWAMGGRGDVM